MKIPTGKKNINGHKNSDGGNAIIPERRMKYLNGSDNNDQDQDIKNKNVKKNVQLAPLDHAHTRNSSVPPVGLE